MTDGPALDVARRWVAAEHYLVATGSAPWAPPIQGLGEVDYLTSTTAMELAERPRSMLVVGGNYIGLEQGQLFARLGTEVTVVEALERLAPAEEPEISAGIERIFMDEGIAVHTGAMVRSVRREQGQVVATIEDSAGQDREVRAEQLLIATGRRPVTGGLGLESVGVQLGALGQIVVDDGLRTANPRIWRPGT
ncbi:mercuric reductase [Amycolatopsis marina]|uniref:Mercuric reductase n=1 Tax=Amycolatopsis marina TaxID=490629 RepID=A0A1I1C404_9PSEU|nr:mercuric reductase [Amycolatopsis marina]